MNAPDLPAAIRRETTDDRARQLYSDELTDARRFSDRLFAKLMILQLVGVIAAALIISPRTWIGDTSAVHTHVWAAILLGALTASAPLLLVCFRPGSAVTRYTVAVAQMMFSALIIHVFGGRIESHFHVFGSLALLAFYRDHRVLAVATAVTALDHGVRGVFWPQSVFGVLNASDFRWLEHAGWIVFEVVFLSLSIKHAEARSLVSNRRAAELEEAKQELTAISASQQLEVDALRLALDRHMIVSMTDRSGRIISVNPKFCEISGYTENELLGEDHRLINSGRHPKKFWVDMWRVIAGGTPWRGEVCNAAKDGALYWVDSTIVPIRGGSGQIERFLSIRFDITDRKLAEFDNQRLAAIIASTEDAVFSVNEEGLVASWNRGAELLFGVNVEEVIGEPLSACFTDGRAAMDEESIVSIAARGLTLVNHETIIRAHDGRILNAAVTISPLRDENEKTVGASFIARDISSQKQTEYELRHARERAETASASKSDFLANMSHEIRTPMTAILGYADLIAQTEQNDPEAASNAAAAIQRNGAHLLALINDILDLSRVEAGKLTIEREPVFLGALLEDAAALLAERAAAKQLDLDINYLTPIPEHINSDPVRLRQIIVNLLGNAIKFTERGGVTIDVAHDEDAGDIDIRVMDTGVGVPEDRRDDLFEAFTQADASSTRRHGGSGLGLCISRRLARLLGGEVELESSEPGKGSVFALRIPASAEADVPLVRPDANTKPPAVPAPAKPPLPGDGLPLEGARILYVEDGPDNQRIISHFLRKAGADVKLADDGAAGLAALCRDEDPGAELLDPQPFDLILTDMQMPVMDGYTAVAAYREKGGRLPVIALTAHAMRGDREKCLEAGCDDYAAKPVDRDPLVELCASWIERAATQTAA